MTSDAIDPISVPEPSASSEALGGSTGLRVFVYAVSLVIFTYGAVDLCGWTRHIELFPSLLPRYTSMKPNTAVALLLLAVALFCRRANRLPRVQQIAGDAFAAAALLLGALSLAEHIFHISVHIDTMVTAGPFDAFRDHNGLMSAGTALDILLVGIALFFLDRRRVIAVSTAFAECIITLSALVGFVFNAGPLFGVPILRSSSPHAAAALFLLGLGSFAARPACEPMLSILGTGRHRLTRTWFFFGTCALPLLISFPILLPLRHGWYDAGFSFALLIIALIVMQSILIWKNSHSLLQMEEGRLITERALVQNEKLAVTGRLAASIAHEINNPLESVTNLLFIARGSSDVAEIHDYLDTADRELRRVALITSQTLQFNRQSTQARAITADELFDGILALHHGRIVNSNISVERRHRTASPIVCFDSEIRQVLSNLIGNAIDAMHPGGGRLLLRTREHVGTANANRGLLITVADTGPGMPPAIVQHIFEPFFTTKGIGGTGLGLWICREIVQRHRGSLHVRTSQSSESSGSVFNVFLPFEAAVR